MVRLYELQKVKGYLLSYKGGLVDSVELGLGCRGLVEGLGFSGLWGFT